MMRLVVLFLGAKSAFGDWVNPEITTFELPWFHPPIEWVSANRIGFTGVHPELDNDSTFQAWIAENTGRRHQFFDDSTVS
jgi:hypothetical protein